MKKGRPEAAFLSSPDVSGDRFARLAQQPIANDCQDQRNGYRQQPAKALIGERKLGEDVRHPPVQLGRPSPSTMPKSSATIITGTNTRGADTQSRSNRLRAISTMASG